MAQASLKVINLLLHVFGILLMRDEAFTSRLTLTSVVVILTLRLHRLCLLWT